MSRRCLGQNVVELVDGRLSPLAVEQAHTHLASCLPCRAAVIAQREAAARLRASQGPVPSLDFMLRLGSIPISQAGVNAASPTIPVQNTTAVVNVDAYRNRGVAASRRPRTKTASIAAVSVAGLVAAAAWAGVSSAQVAVSVPSVSQTSVVPMITTFSQVHRQTAQGMPFAGATYVDADYQSATSHRSFHAVP